MEDFTTGGTASCRVAARIEHAPRMDTQTPDRRIIERRREIRTSTNQRGVIKFGAAGTELACTVHDLTMGGAGLSVGTSFGVPQVFRLTIDGQPNTRHCRVVWREGKRLGVLFE
jgi:hypothetical protein